MLEKNYACKIFQKAGIGLRETDILSIDEHVESTYNYVYRIRATNEDYILKKAKKNLKSLEFSSVKLDHVKRLETDFNVSNIFRMILGKEIIPEIYYYKREKPIMLMHAFEGHILKEDLLRGIIDNEIFVKIGKIIGKIHSSTYNVFSESHPLFENIQNREEELKTHYYAIADIVKGNLSRKIIELAELHRKRKLCIIHGDLTSKNIIIDNGNVHLIDFELSHLGSPEYDLGHFLAEYFLASIGLKKSCPDLNEFFKSYFSEFSDIMSSEKDKIRDNALKHSAVIMLFRLGGMAKTDFLNSDSRKEVFFSIKDFLEKNNFEKGIDENLLYQFV